MMVPPLGNRFAASPNVASGASCAPVAVSLPFGATYRRLAELTIDGNPGQPWPDASKTVAMTPLPPLPLAWPLEISAASTTHRNSASISLGFSNMGSLIIVKVLVKNSVRHTKCRWTRSCSMSRCRVCTIEQFNKLQNNHSFINKTVYSARIILKSK